jgi:hypothetical protein
MAAGLGFKDFVTGEVLTAADVDGYLMQGIWVFASAAARDAAVTSPQEGNACYLKDTNQVLTYSGSAWVAVGGGSPLTTKGDVYGFSTVDARIPVGANDTVLTADSTQALGVKWGTVSAGANWSLLNTGGTTLTGATTITVSGISGKDKIMVVVAQGAGLGSGVQCRVRFNADSGANYDINGVRWNGSSFTTISSFGDTSLLLAQNGSSGGSISGYVQLSGCNASGLKVYTLAGGTNSTASEDHWHGATYNGTSTISSVSIISSSGNWTGGKVYVYTSA